MLSGSLMAQPAICYEHILRAIGQGLESVSLEAFDLEVANDTFLIQGTPTRKESEKSSVAKLNSFKKTFLGICHTSTKPKPAATPAVQVPGSSRTLRLQFTQPNIDKLERHGQALRSDWNGSPLAHSMPQLLRTVGWYVDHKRGRLHRISNHGESMIVSYTGSLGTEKIERFTMLQFTTCGFVSISEEKDTSK